ncbi:MAG: helix-turn-helix transcriptional regulator, partial [Firmicutes bacterium]|nr:helix-turn-helix transcriptional regulator [Bacillota bacterium]
MPRTVNTRERLINSAIDLTAEYGIENVTVRRIAEMLGYSEATLYRHFGSRDELLEEAFITVDAKISSRFLDSPYVKEAPTDIIELIHRV